MKYTVKATSHWSGCRATEHHQHLKHRPVISTVW